MLRIATTADAAICIQLSGSVSTAHLGGGTAAACQQYVRNFVLIYLVVPGTADMGAVCGTGWQPTSKACGRLAGTYQGSELCAVLPFR